MNRKHNKQSHITLLSLLIAFLFSTVGLPAINADADTADSGVHLQTNHPQSSAGLPLTLPEEEKEEEENRSHEDHFFLVASLPVEFDWLANRYSPTTWAFNHTNASALTQLPLYLAKHTLLI